MTNNSQPLRLGTRGREAPLRVQTGTRSRASRLAFPSGAWERETVDCDGKLASFPSSAWERAAEKLRFESRPGREAELRDWRSQAELGNEKRWIAMVNWPRSQAPLGNARPRSSASSPDRDAKQSFETGVPKRSLGTRNGGLQW